MPHPLYTDPPKPGQIWQHFKGHKYRVIGLFSHSETQELMIGYISADETLSSGVGWVRPANMWHDQINRETYKGPRFRRNQ